jgi:hypothetical protein
MVSVLGDHYKYKFTKEELFKLTSKINTIKSAPLVKGDSNKSALQSRLIIEPSSNYLRFNIDSCTVTINFDQPVLQTGEDEYRVFTSCECCGGECGPTNYSDVLGGYRSANRDNSYQITKGQYDSFQLGGTIYWSSTTDVNYGSMSCGFSHSDSITVLPGQCMAEGFGISATTTCINDCAYYGGACPPGYPPPVPRGSSTGINIIVFTDQGEYYVHVSGYIQCPIGNGTTICVPVYYYIGEIYTRLDNPEYVSFLGADIRYDSDGEASGGWTLNFIPNTPDAPNQ